jgi:hypothetical protein
MKKIALVILLFLSAFAWAKENPNPADYTINVHVSASKALEVNGSGGGYLQKLTVGIDGKNYELEGSAGGPFLLALGDYKAKIVTDEHKGTYDLLRVYEFLFPDQKTRKFTMVGQTE